MPGFQLPISSPNPLTANRPDFGPSYPKVLRNSTKNSGGSLVEKLGITEDTVMKTGAERYAWPADSGRNPLTPPA